MTESMRAPTRSVRSSGRAENSCRAKRRTVQANIAKAPTRSTAKTMRLIGGYRNAVAPPPPARVVRRCGKKRRMALNRELIDILACPKCKGAIKLRDDQSAFECPNCKLAYLVVDDIPNFIIEEAQPLK